MQHRYGNHPLVLAASLNQPKIIQLLVSHQIISPHLLNEALQVGAKLGHYGVVKSLLESGVDVSRLDETGKSIFQLALEHGRLEIAGLLMDADWPIDREHVRKEAAQSALCEACSKGMRGIVSDLLLEENLVHVNETDKHGKLPIVCAAKGGHLSVVRLLLSKGTSFEMKDEEHKTPLIAAVENNHQEIVEFLINEGADVDEVDSNGRTPLIISASEGYDQMVEVLIMEGM